VEGGGCAAGGGEPLAARVAGVCRSDARPLRPAHRRVARGRPVDLTLTELAAEARRLSGLLDKGVQALRQTGLEFAQAEHDYRQAKATVYPDTVGTVAEREAQTYGMVGDLRHRRDAADAVRTAALEAVRSRRAQLSAVQTLLHAHKAEADFERTGPR
jgi:hypothetical protein